MKYEIEINEIARLVLSGEAGGHVRDKVLTILDIGDDYADEILKDIGKKKTNTMQRVVIIHYEESPLVVALVEEPFLLKGVLDCYARDYDFDRKKLSGVVKDTWIEMGPQHGQTHEDLCGIKSTQS